MKLMLLTAGSRGDVEPFAALAAHAAALGHEVHLGVPDDADVDLAGVERISAAVAAASAAMRDEDGVARALAIIEASATRS